MEGVSGLSEGLCAVSESLAESLSREPDAALAGGGCGLRAATNQIVHVDAPCIREERAGKEHLTMNKAIYDV